MAEDGLAEGVQAVVWGALVYLNEGWERDRERGPAGAGKTYSCVRGGDTSHPL